MELIGKLEKLCSENEFTSVNQGDEITTYEDKVKTGYKLAEVEPEVPTTPLVISSDYKKNVIKVYYDFQDYKYTVHYFYEKIGDDGEYVEDTDETETGSAVFGSKISTYEAKAIEGYEFNHDETEDKDGVKGNLPLTITSNKNTRKLRKVVGVRKC